MNIWDIDTGWIHAPDGDSGYKPDIDGYCTCPPCQRQREKEKKKKDKKEIASVIVPDELFEI